MSVFLFPVCQFVDEEVDVVMTGLQLYISLLPLPFVLTQLVQCDSPIPVINNSLFVRKHIKQNDFRRFLNVFPRSENLESPILVFTTSKFCTSC